MFDYKALNAFFISHPSAIQDVACPGLLRFVLFNMHSWPVSSQQSITIIIIHFLSYIILAYSASLPSYSVLLYFVALLVALLLVSLALF